MASLSFLLTLEPNTTFTFTPRIWSDILNNLPNIQNLDRRLEVIRNLKLKLEQEASIIAAQPQPFPISTMFLNDAMKSLKEQEVIAETIKKNRTSATHVWIAEETLHGRRSANGSRHNAGPSTNAILFGTNLLNPERHRATEATLNLNKRKRDSTVLGLPSSTFAAMPTTPVQIPRASSNVSIPFGSPVTPISFSEKGKEVVGDRTPRLLFRSSQQAPAPAPVLLDRGKQPIQPSGNATVRAQPRPQSNQRFPAFLLNRINRNTGV